MEHQTEYDILKLVENQGRCYVSSDCMPGMLLATCLKYRPSLPRDQLLAWMRQILQELEKFHRCRGNPAQSAGTAAPQGSRHRMGTPI